MLKQSFLQIFLILLASVTFAQQRVAVRPDSSMLRSIPKTGRAFGQVLDAKTNLPVEFATIAVIAIRDSAIAGGALTDEKGKFNVSELPAFGRFKLRVSFLGYSTFESQPFALNRENTFYDAGAIRIAVNEKNLKEVTITGEKGEFQNAVDRKIYNVDKNIVNTGGTATEVLQNIPSVTVDMDGNVSLRGSGAVTVYIDGKPSGLTGSSRQAVLQQIPSSAIEQVEVITNPSAKYDAEGMAGIINIKTKKGKRQGMNGNITAGAGTNNKYNASVGLNNRTEKLNIYGNYAFRSEEREISGGGLQQNNFPLGTYNLETETNGENKNLIHTAKAGFDYNINNYNTIGANGSFTNRSEDRPETTINTFDFPLLASYSIYRENFTDELNDTYEGGLDYKRTFRNSKRELTASGSYSFNTRHAYNEFKNSLNDYGSIPYQQNTNETDFITAVIQTDYAHPFAKSKLETGLKGSMRNTDNLLLAYLYSPFFAQYVNDDRFTDHFIYDEKVYAAYALYSGKWKSFDYSAGLRGEQTISSGDSKATQTEFTNDYFALFPSASVKYNWKGSNDLLLSYSRRTNRPGLQSLNPFKDYSDSLNVRTGNPYLKPEYINSFELGYTKTTDAVTASATVYYRHIDDVLSRYRSVDITTGVATLTQINFNTADNIGLEGIFRYQIGKVGSLMASFNIFQNTVNGKNIDPDIQGTNTNWNTRLTANLRAGKSLSFQLTGMYSAPDKQPQRTIKGMMTGVDAGMKYEFWKGKASLSLNVTDIFNQRKFQIHIEQDYYTYDGFRKRESQVTTLTFAYRFGTQENTLFNRKKSQRNPVQEGPGENMDNGAF